MNISYMRKSIMVMMLLVLLSLAASCGSAPKQSEPQAAQKQTTIEQPKPTQPSESAQGQQPAASSTQVQPEQPQGNCTENVPQEVTEGPLVWLSNSRPAIGSAVQVCVRLIENGKPVQGATAEALVKYLDNRSFQATKEHLKPIQTGADGIGVFTFQVADTTECEIEVTIKHNDKTYDVSNYDDQLSLFFYTQ